MTIPDYITGITQNITNQIKLRSITPVIVGNGLTDLANIVSNTSGNIGTGATQAVANSGLTIVLSDYYTIEQVNEIALSGASVDLTQYYTKIAADARFVLTGTTYTDPTFIGSLNWSKIINEPTTLSGYSISLSDTLFDGKYLSLISGNTLLGLINVNTNNITILQSGLTIVQSGLTQKQNIIPTGLTSQYFRGDLSLALFPTGITSFTNNAGYLTGITSGNVITALGYVPSSGGTGVSAFSALTGIPNTLVGYGITSGDTLFNNKYQPVGAYLTGITSGAIDAALGYVPENVANKVTGLTSPNNTTYPTTLAVFNAISGATAGVSFFNGRTGAVSGISSDYSAFYYPLSSNPLNFITGITSSAVTGALGYVPVAPSALTTYLTTSGASVSYVSAATLNNYLTVSGASSTFASATTLNNYLTLTGASTTYQPIGNYASASTLNNYLTNSGASTTYQPIGSYLTGVTSSAVTGALGYVPVAPSALTTYLTLSGASATYVSASTLVNYLTTSGASTTYQPIGSYLTGITSSAVTTALGYIPVAPSALTTYLTLSGASSVYQPIGSYASASTLNNYYTTGQTNSLYYPLTGNPSSFYSTSASSITSSQLATSMSDETGTGSLVFNTSPSFSGTPSATTATLGTNNTQIATTAFVTNAISTVTGSTSASANTFYAGASGGTGTTTATFRQITNADLPIFYTDNTIFTGGGTSSADTFSIGILPRTHIPTFYPDPNIFAGGGTSTGDTFTITNLGVSYGGIGLSATTPYALFVGGTGTTSKLQQVSSLGTSGQVLTSNGTGALPTWQTISGSTGSSNNIIFNSGFTGSGTTGSPITLITDTTPTSGSTHPITSGGVYTALNNTETLTVDSGLILSTGATLSLDSTIVAIQSQSNYFSQGQNIYDISGNPQLGLLNGSDYSYFNLDSGGDLNISTSSNIVNVNGNLNITSGNCTSDGGLFYQNSTNCLGLGVTTFTNSSAPSFEASSVNGGGIYLTKTGSLAGYVVFENDGNAHFKGDNVGGGLMIFSAPTISFRGSANGSDQVVFPNTGAPIQIPSFTTAGVIINDASGNLGTSGTTGTGTFVRTTSPILVTPNLGVASATSLTIPAFSTAGVILNSATGLLSSSTSIGSLTALGMGAGISSGAYILIAASQAGKAQLQLTSGVAVTALTSGDLWRTTGSSIFFYDGSTTQQFPFLATTNTWTGVNKFLDFYATSAVPTQVAGTGAGTTPTISIVGNNMDGKITITTGTLPTASGIVTTVTMSGSFAYPTSTACILEPGNALTAALNGTSQVFVTGTTTTFVITAGTVGLVAATTYIWNYHNGGY